MHLVLSCCAAQLCMLCSPARLQSVLHAAHGAGPARCSIQPLSTAATNLSRLRGLLPAVLLQRPTCPGVSVSRASSLSALSSRWRRPTETLQLLPRLQPSMWRLRCD